MHSSPDIIRVSRSRRMRKADHVILIRENKNACRDLVGKPEGKRPAWKTGERVINRMGCRRRLCLSGSVNAQEVGWCEHGCELSGCIKCRLERVS